MHTRLASLLSAVSAVALALAFAAGSSLAGSSTTLPGIQIAEGEKSAPQPAPTDTTIEKPKTYSETPADVSACEKTWDPQTQMTKEEYEKSCKRTLKYFPEKP